MDSRGDNSPKKWKNRTLVVSMEFTVTGIITALKEERNTRKYTASTILASIVGAIFRISTIERLFLLLAVLLVITLEIINSATEDAVDLTSNYHSSMLVKDAKDMAANAVLVVSGYAVLTGSIISVPKIIVLIFGE